MRLFGLYVVIIPLWVLTLTSGPSRGRVGNVSRVITDRGVDLSSLDQTCEPCKDFFQYANGGWINKNPIPADYPSWGRFDELQLKNQTTIRQILEEASTNSRSSNDSVEQKVGAFYRSCMAEDKIEAAGLKPLQQELARINQIKDLLSLQKEIAHLHSINVNALFLVGPKQDATKSSRVIVEIWQGGLGLPEGDYYFKEDDKTKKIRNEYVKHIARMFELIGDDATLTGAEAQTVIGFETTLAEAWMPRVKRRDPREVYNRKTLEQIKTFIPNFSWVQYLNQLGLPRKTDINVGQPKFFERVNKLLTLAPLPDWKTYLRWRLIDDAASALSSRLVEEDFNFKGRTLNGTPEMQRRWKRCVAATESAMGEAVGRLFVKKTFPPEAKARALEMVRNLESALRNNISTLSWMSNSTRRQALAKLDAVVNKIGYPDKWPDYSSLRIDSREFLFNRMRANSFGVRRELNKVGKPVNRTEWVLTPQVVDAGYVAAMNEIVFPAGILQPPSFDPTADDAVNYGAMGAVIGHEITHGFDDQGRQYDAKGNLVNWWSAEDVTNFQTRASCIVDQFDSFEVEPGLHINGKLVVGESIADLGGLTIAYAAFQKSLEGRPRPKEIDGFTAEQRFFLGWAQMWAENARPEFTRLQVNRNPHPPTRFRVNGPLSNMTVFAQAFSCRTGDHLVRPAIQRCEIW